MCFGILGYWYKQQKNLVSVNKGAHRVMHTNFYYVTLNTSIIAGYILEQDEGVEKVLNIYQVILGGL